MAASGDVEEAGEEEGDREKKGRGRGGVNNLVSFAQLCFQISNTTLLARYRISEEFKVSHPIAHHQYKRIFQPENFF